MKWQIKEKPHYKWSECRRLFNTRTDKEIAKTINGGSIGYWIGKDFVPLSKMKEKIEIIKDEKLPF